MNSAIVSIDAERDQTTGSAPGSARGCYCCRIGTRHGGLLTIDLDFAGLIPRLVARHRVIAVELQGHARLKRPYRGRRGVAEAACTCD